MSLLFKNNFLSIFVFPTFLLTSSSALVGHISAQFLLLDRNIRFCDRKDSTGSNPNNDSSNRVCTNFIGQGSCLDQNGLPHNYCQFYEPIPTLKSCQEFAQNIDSAIGIQFFINPNDSNDEPACRLLFDQFTSNADIETICSSSYYAYFTGNVGAGPITQVDPTQSLWTCYTCDEKK